MQQAPARLSQTIWLAFRASKPIHRSRLQLQSTSRRLPELWFRRDPAFARQIRSYSDKPQDIDRKAEDAKSRIEDALDSRAQAASQPDTVLKPPEEEIIVHTNPEASSIVHERTSPSSQDANSPRPPTSPSKPRPNPLPSEKPSHTSPVRQRFASFMDNFQSHLFTASQRLNDLTGYSGIEALKNDISAQEDHVSSSRKAVNKAREKYAAAIATRSTTQREVNDLLHRKHAWSSVDLERFTSLYRSDHANEQAEVAAQKQVGDAETTYEEASTKLARTILARYHEEQIWSDKIRQMSTWGTWGLMGLNVLLFVVFQIMIEPWRRKRLVKGFEDKVEVALRERDTDLQNALKYGVRSVRPDSEGSVPTSADAGVLPVEPGTKLDGIADHIAEQIVDAVSGSTASPSVSTSDPSPPSPSPSPSDTEATPSPLTHDFPSITASIQPAPVPAFPSPSSAYASYEEAFRDLFSERKLVVTQKEMTTVALEGAVGGAAVIGLILVLLRPR